MTETEPIKIHPSVLLARAAAAAADEKLGRDIVVLDIRGQSALTDCFVFISATSHVHVRALEDGIREGMRAAGGQLIRTDGQRGNVWRVLDYGSVLIHIMDEKTREFYSVERLWDQAKSIGVAKKPEPETKRAKKKKRAFRRPVAKSKKSRPASKKSHAKSSKPKKRKSKKS